ncbi:hypothetical protein DPMN_174315 [Dreissena polymorpha]|uniref:Uncharacterized protein n=1 Tax=Dreissena polymorpha TaxID=45954 RepID=A0A9D4E783_DREPO|nr:hypothetical protein DPMN_174315 [Dreissena polymorpha]
MPAFHIMSSDDSLRVTTSLPKTSRNTKLSPEMLVDFSLESFCSGCSSCRGHINLGSNPCWYSHALNLPGSPVWSISFRPFWSWLLNLLMLLVSFRLASYHLPRHLTGLSLMDGLSFPCTCRVNLLVTFPFLMIRVLDFLGLNFNRAHVTASSRVVSTQWACTCVVVVIVRSSMNPLLDERFITDTVFGPLVSLPYSRH